MTFSIKESIKFGWKKTKEHLGLAIATSFVYLIFNIGLNIGGGDDSIGTEEDFAGRIGALIVIVIIAILVGLLFAVINTIVQIGYTKIYLKLHDGEKASFKELFTNYKPFWRYLGASILYGLRVLLGLILLIVPGIIWAIKYQFMLTLVVDKGMRPVEAMRESARITEGHKWHLLKFGLAMAAINILGFICLGVGVLIAMPVTMFAYVHVYRKLLGAEIQTVPSPEDPPLTIPESEPTIMA